LVEIGDRLGDIGGFGAGFDDCGYLFGLSKFSAICISHYLNTNNYYNPIQLELQFQQFNTRISQTIQTLRIKIPPTQIIKFFTTSLYFPACNKKNPCIFKLSTYP
jgi:hypothetical protein